MEYDMSTLSWKRAVLCDLASDYYRNIVLYFHKSMIVATEVLLMMRYPFQIKYLIELQAGLQKARCSQSPFLSFTGTLIAASDF